MYNLDPTYFMLFHRENLSSTCTVKSPLVGNTTVHEINKYRGDLFCCCLLNCQAIDGSN